MINPRTFYSDIFELAMIARQTFGDITELELGIWEYQFMQRSEDYRVKLKNGDLHLFGMVVLCSTETTLVEVR